MIIETQRVRLRSLTPADLDDYHTQVYGDAEVMTYISGGQPRSRERTNDVLQFALRHGETYGYTLWALINRADDKFIGHCGLLHPGESREVELVCALGRDYQKFGLGPEAAAACLRYGFESARLERIIALAYPDNLASQKGMQKLGMQYVGLTELYYHATLVYYELNRSDWQAGTDEYRLIP